jgi:hypothetical protein
MNSGSSDFIYDINLAPGEALALPSTAVPIVGPGSWRITIEPYDGLHPEGAPRDHAAVVASDSSEDEGLNRPAQLQSLRFRLSTLLGAFAVVAFVLTLSKSFVAEPLLIFAATAIICLGAINAIMWLIEDVQSTLGSIDQSH